MVLARLGHLLVGKRTVVGVSLAGALSAESVAGRHKLSQVAIRIFSQGCSARYIVLQGKIIELLLARAPLLLLKVKLAAVNHAVFSGLRDATTRHVSVRLLDSLLRLAQDILRTGGHGPISIT